MAFMPRYFAPTLEQPVIQGDTTMPDIIIEATDGGGFGAHLATPSSGAGPGLVVIQEIFGVNRDMRDLCDGFAASGYIACCPD